MPFLSTSQKSVNHTHEGRGEQNLEELPSPLARELSYSPDRSNVGLQDDSILPECSHYEEGKAFFRMLL